MTGSDIKKRKGNPLLESGKDILAKTMKKNINAELKKQGISTRSKEAKAIVEARIESVMNFMDAMNDFMEETGLQYTFIGMQDVHNAKISVRKTSDGVQAITMSAMVKNGEYPINFDFTTICKKRQAFNAIIEKLTAESAEGVDISLSPQELGEINNALRKEGLETACLGCFVEARRYNMQNYTNKVCDLWNKCVDEYAASIGVDPADIEDFNFSNGEETTEEKFQDASDTFFAYENTSASKKNPEDRFKHIIRSSQKTYMKHLHPADLITSNGIQHIKDMSTKSKDFFGMLKSAYGVAAPKETIKYVPYNSEVALLPENRGKDNDGNTQTMLDYLKSIGGIRMQSFSDYLVANTFDYMQMVADMAARGFPAHAYTKEIAFARVFGMTGIKINLSIMYDVQNLNYWRDIFKNADDERLREIASKYAGLQYFENADDIPEEFKDYDDDGNLILDHGSIMEIDEDGVKGYLTYLVGDENRSQRHWEETFKRVLEETGDEELATEQANEYRKWIQSINFKEAKELQSKKGYGANCGMIGVGLSDANILLMLNDDNMPYIIPYHASGLPDVIKQHTGLNFATNYEDTQNTRIFVSFTKDGEELGYDYVRDLKNELGSWQKAWEKVSEEIRNGDIVANGRTPRAKTETEPAEVNKDGNPYVLHGTADFDFYGKLENGATPQEAAEMYLDYCDEYGLLPVFPQFAGHPNYYKLLVDYSVTDLSNKKATSPQGTVKNIYPGSDGTIANIDEGSTDYEGIKGILEDEFKKLDEKNKHRDEVVEKIVNEWERHSISAEMDAAYMDAVNSGNMEEAQRLVDEAAKMAMPNSKLIQDGKFWTMWHHTNADFTSFLPGTSSSSGGLKGIYLTPHEHAATSNLGGIHGQFYINVENPKFAFGIKADKEHVDHLRKMQEGITDREELANINRQFKEETGIDAFFDWQNGWYNVLTPEQIKSADTITYAEDGSIIPLSERFDPNNNDIRYSLPTTDADGNVLTDGQMEYFKNSKARKKGRLVPVYHTTNEGGFTVFDPMRSDDHRSFFFSSSREISETYAYDSDEEAFLDTDEMTGEALNDQTTRAGIYSCYLNLENPLVINGKGQTWDAISINPKIPAESHLEIHSADWFIRTADSYEDSFQQEKKQKKKRGYNTPDDRLYNWENHLKGKEYKKDGNKAKKNNEVVLKFENGERIFVKNNSDAIMRSINTHYNLPEDDSAGLALAEELIRSMNEVYPSGVVSGNGWLNDSMIKELTSESHDTREWAEIAYNEGYDGVIFRNIIDYGGDPQFLNELKSDIYVAFSSNQIKDINNENPTENPDIRYSIPPEDEAMSQEAHEYIYDDSPEALEYYETIIEQMSKEDLSDGFINHPMQTFLENLRKYGKADERARKGKSGAVKYRNDRDFTSAFFDGLAWYDTGMKFDDPVLEEGRTRMAKSRNDFFNSNRAKWNQMWETNGEVLDVRSIRKPVKQLVMDTMRLAYTNTKYKNDIVNMTLIDMRMAYWYAQRGRIDVADALLWHTANRMVTSVKYIEDDTEFKRYKEIRDFIRHTNISMSEEYWEDEQFRYFRKKHFGKLNITQGLITNVEVVYQELEERWPDIFNDEQREKIGLVGNIKSFGDNNGDLLTHIGYVVDQNLTPFIEAYSSEEAAALTESIASSLLDIMQENGEALQSKADRYVEQINAMKTRHAEALQSKADRYVEQINAMKTRHAEALQSKADR